MAAQEAVILDRLLAEDVPMERLAQNFFAAIQDTIATPWGVAVNDFRLSIPRAAFACPTSRSACNTVWP